MLRNGRVAAPLTKGHAGAWLPQRARYWRVWSTAAISMIALWVERGRSRRVLAALDDHRLRDIGLSRADAQLESEKPFWRP